MKTKILNEEVIFADEEIVTVDIDFIKNLKELANKNERKRIRLCTHKNLNENIHEMLIVHTNNTYVKPHKHINKIESFHVIEGIADIIIFDDDGKISKVIPIGELGSGLNFYYRLAEPLFHSLIIKSEYLVFHETTNGPFRKEDTVWAKWAPDEDNINEVNTFTKRCLGKINIKKKGEGD